MIVGLSQEVCLRLQEIDRIEKMKGNAESISATLEALLPVKKSVDDLVAAIMLLRNRLHDHDVQNVLFTLGRLAKEIRASRERFETEPRQTKALSNIQASIQKLMKEIKWQWQLYARERIREPLELFDLVKNLPEVEAQQTVYGELKRRLERYAEEIPLTAEKLTDFDQSLDLLTQRLRSIEGLNAEVKVFLQRTLNGEATLADLTDEVLQWCRQGGHAQIFAVRFTR